VFELSVKASFSAAHHLEAYPGKCADPHGHNWDVEVFVQGESVGATGMLIDFRELRELVKGVLDELDHQDLNTLPMFRDQNPTSENLARYLYQALLKRWQHSGCSVSRVLIRETPGSVASYWE
jgi:6-pyruvoyltetrahydropterin/6-carboxytetrahydropterin synthase